MLPRGISMTLRPGTDFLFRGIGEPIIYPPSVAGDGCFWLADSRTMARTYIPVSGLRMLAGLDTFLKPPDQRSDTGAIQRQLGFEFTDVAYDECGKARSYRLPLIYDQLLVDIPWPKKEDFANASDYYDASHRRQRIGHERFTAWVMDRLREYGYEPEKNCSTPGYERYQFKVSYQNGKTALLHKNYRLKGTLLTFTFTKPLVIFDLTRGGRVDGDLLDPDYRKYDLFASLKEQGYDGVKINDFAQVENHGNVGHTSIGLFSGALAYVREVRREITTHPEDLWGDLAEERGVIQAA